jgi:ABC-type branched-subunit amino acid transport system ATPase component
MAIADLACIMEKGHIVLSGSPGDLGPYHVKKAYLGM